MAVTSSRQAVVTLPGDTQILITREFDAPRHLVYKAWTTPELVTALLRNDVDVGFDYYAGFQSVIDDKKIHVAAVSGETRAPLLPNVPTARESGFPDYVVVGWNALAAPAGLPADVLNILNREVNSALADPEVQRKAVGLGMIAQGSTPQEMRARMEQEINRWAAVIEKAGIERQ